MPCRPLPCIALPKFLCSHTSTPALIDSTRGWRRHPTRIFQSVPIISDSVRRKNAQTQEHHSGYVTKTQNLWSSLAAVVVLQDLVGNALNRCTSAAVSRSFMWTQRSPNSELPQSSSPLSLGKVPSLRLFTRYIPGTTILFIRFVNTSVQSTCFLQHAFIVEPLLYAILLELGELFAAPARAPISTYSRGPTHPGTHPVEYGTRSSGTPHLSD